MVLRLALTLAAVSLFSCYNESLDVIEISSEIPIGWDEKTPCLIHYYHLQDSVVLSGKIKCRGGFSSRYFKQSYSLELDKKYSLGDINRDDDWILNANYIDKTFMRHKISYDLFREMGIDNESAKCEYVEVYLQKKYKGIYVLMEELNAKKLGVNKKDALGMVFKDPPIYEALKPDSIPVSENYYQQKFPKISKQDNSKYIEHFMNFLNYSTDLEFIKNINYWVDVENIADWHLLLLLTNNSDGILKNFYWYKIDENTPFRVAIWDYDHSFGRDGDNDLNMMTQTIDCKRSILLKRLLEVEDSSYRNLLTKKWKNLRQEVFTYRHINNLILKNDEKISKAINKNFEKWPVNDQWYQDDNTYEQEIEVIQKFIVLRLGQLDQYFEKHL